MSAWTYMYMTIKGQGHLLTLVQDQSVSRYSNVFSLWTAGPFEAKFHVEPPWDRGMMACSNGLGHMTNMADMSIYGKKKIFFSGTKTKNPMTLKCGMQHRVLKDYPVCANDNTGLTLTYFTSTSNLVPYAFIWNKRQNDGFFKNYCSL